MDEILNIFQTHFKAFKSFTKANDFPHKSLWSWALSCEALLQHFRQQSD